MAKHQIGVSSHPSTSMFILRASSLKSISLHPLTSGHPLIPTNQLTAQALVGIGWGCREQRNGPTRCDGSGADTTLTEVVWVTPVNDAKIFVDPGDGNPTFQFEDRIIKALESVAITDPYDDDMSGAYIYAQDAGGSPVKMALAWGQDPRRTSGGPGLDAGYVVFSDVPLDASKSAELIEDRYVDGRVNPGERLKCECIVPRVLSPSFLC